MLIYRLSMSFSSRFTPVLLVKPVIHSRRRVRRPLHHHHHHAPVVGLTAPPSSLHVGLSKFAMCPRGWYHYHRHPPSLSHISRRSRCHIMCLHAPTSYTTYLTSHVDSLLCLLPHLFDKESTIDRNTFLLLSCVSSNISGGSC